MDIDLEIKLSNLIKYSKKNCNNKKNTLGIMLLEEEFIDILNNGAKDYKLNIPIKIKDRFLNYIHAYYHELEYEKTVFSSITNLKLTYSD